uniref:Uncharacterized protein n=1 Tax=Ciona savignyi TaxID=51511 RepID=H2Y9J1_CIOSA
MSCTRNHVRYNKKGLYKGDIEKKAYVKANLKKKAYEMSLCCNQYHYKLQSMSLYGNQCHYTTVNAIILQSMLYTTVNAITLQPIYCQRPLNQDFPFVGCISF